MLNAVYVTCFMSYMVCVCVCVCVRASSTPTPTAIFTTIANTAVDVTQMEPRVVLRKGRLIILKFVDHHVDNLPDISERPVIPLKATRFWMMDDKGVIDPNKRHRKPHSRLPGMSGQATNKAIDFAISLNGWPVTFKDDDDVTINLVDRCIIMVWLSYIGQLKGHPMAESNSCQLILKYMLLNRDALVKAYHDRMYYYSSGTKFIVESVQLFEWIKKMDRKRDVYAEDHDDMSNAPMSAKKALSRLVDVDGLYAILGDAVIDFIREKPQPFGVRALKSKEDFWNVPVFKRALFFVFFARYALNYKSMRNWQKFLQQDYKFNSRCFKRWCDSDDAIMEASPQYQNMPDRIVVPSVPRKRISSEDAFSSDSPMKRRFVVLDSSTSDSE